MRIVCDTNVIVSGLLWKGPPKRVIDLLETKKVRLCLTPKIIEEVRRVIDYPKFSRVMSEAVIDPGDVVAYLLEYADLFHDRTILRVVKEDPSDDMFINCALIGGARYIISGDRHLLQLKQVAEIPIVTPLEFLKHIESP